MSSLVQLRLRSTAPYDRLLHELTLFVLSHLFFPLHAVSQSQAILDFSQPLDVTLLDQVAQVFLTGSGAQVSLSYFSTISSQGTHGPNV